MGARHHRKKANYKDFLPVVTFSEALNNKICKGYLHGFVDDTSSLTLEQHWEQALPAKLWDNDRFATQEEKTLFQGINCLTNDIVKLIKKAVLDGDRQVLRDNLKLVDVLRVNDEKMTEFDDGILDFKKVVSVNLCGNYLTDIDNGFIPPTIRSLELQANHITDITSFAETLPQDLVYLGLARNLLNDECVQTLSRLPIHLTVLDISNNDIYNLNPVVDALALLPSLSSLDLAGNPCAVCAGYAKLIIMTLPHLKWLDSRKILPTDRPLEPYEMHPDDLLATYFYFTIFRVMGAPQPPKPERGGTTTFHVELELPLLDSERRRFLMFRRYESLTEILPSPEEEEIEPQLLFAKHQSSKVLSAIQISVVDDEASSRASEIYRCLENKSSRIIYNFTTFKSNKIQWNKVMNFQEPAVKIFCPDLIAIRNTFRSVITVRLVYTVVYPKSGKVDKKSAHSIKMPTEQRAVLATMKCALRDPDWTQPSQHFHWDVTLGTNEAIHWGDRDLSVLQYTQAPVKVSKGKADSEGGTSLRQTPPVYLTCHFGFGIETLHLQ